ncbi:uncharacterized protein [Periplaneta americana]|uniref:uncharacterized protein n=1 Tax=Periplaneta americana TaxID=6978 RepID=UPI0037E70699
MMRQLICLLLSIEVVRFCGCEVESSNKYNKVLSRKRRYLTFPAGSSFVVNLSFANSYIWELTPAPTWNCICEADLGFSLPNSTRLYFNRGPGREGRSSPGHHELHRRERLELFRNVEALMDLYGVDGRSCMLDALCEAKKILKPGRSLVEDILYVTFKVPEGGGDEFEAYDYDRASNQAFCKSVGSRCPFSLLRYLLQDEST